MQEKLVYPTLGKEELNLSIGPMALTVAEVTTTSLLLFTFLAFLEFKLSVTEWVTFLQLAHLRVFQIIFPSIHHFHWAYG